MKRAVLKCLAFALTAVFAFSALTACNKDKVSISAAKTEVVYNGEAQLPEITVKGTEEKTVEKSMRAKRRLPKRWTRGNIR